MAESPPRYVKIFMLAALATEPGEREAAERAFFDALRSAGIDIHAVARALESPGGPEKKYTDADADEFYRQGIARGRKEMEDAGGFRSTEGLSLRDMAITCRERNARLRNDDERNFVSDMPLRTTAGCELTEKQKKWLRDCYVRVSK